MMLKGIRLKKRWKQNISLISFFVIAHQDDLAGENVLTEIVN